MAYKVAPKTPKVSHYLGLRDAQGRRLGLNTCTDRGRNTKFGVRRTRLQSTSLKIAEGNPKYSDFELPFTPIVQETWEGGRGQEQFERDVSKFLDSYRATTIFPGKVTNGPLETLTSGYRNENKSFPGSVYWQQLIPGSRLHVAVQFAASAAYTAKHIEIILKRRGEPEDLTIKLRGDTGGNPGSTLETLTFAAEDRPDIIGQTERLTLSGTVLTYTAYYWIEVYGGTADDENNCWLVATNNTPNLTKQSADGSSWAGCGVDLYYRICDAEGTSWAPWLYEYKGAMYFATKLDSGGAPALYMNGDRGVADSNAGYMNKLIDATKSWTVDEWVGKVVWITEGPGALEDPPIRTITANSATQLTVDPPYIVEHTTATEYVIVGSDKWTAMTGHGMTVAPTSVLVINNIVYFALGNAVNIKRHREYNNSGTWTTSDWADDGTNKADILAKVNDSSTGLMVWKATNNDVKVAKATATATWGTNLTFGTGISVGDTEEKITALTEYINPDTGEKICWVFKTGSVYAIKSDKPDKIPLDEMRAVMSFHNGKAVLTHNVYLYFSLLYSVERYFSGVLDDIGPTSGRGLPEGRRGPIVDMAGYPGRWFAAVDGGDGYSAILCHNGAGWHEYYRSAVPGLRIRRMRFQVVHGTLPDRLWFSEGNQIKWLAFPSEATDATQDSNFPYTWESAVESSRMYAGLMDIRKLYDSIKVSADDLVEDEQWIEVDYKLDEESATWTQIDSPIVTSPSQEEPLSEIVSLTGRWIIIRVRTLTTDMNKTPKLRSVLVNSVSRIPIRYGWAPTVRLADGDKDLQGEPDEIVSLDEKLALLDEWSESLEALTLDSVFTPFHGKRVFLEGPDLSPYKDEGGDIPKEGFIATIPMTMVLTAAVKKSERTS